ncbi:glycosyltransferase [Cellulomonas sp. ATA003]|uniref:glycosyltransferase family 2 protein n=1 Tax=Cellulomonas sp. ATA003 TaxID=3073064 RepID=UPI002873BCEC|nr:glycosyltransferase [Cellulomonas sp. ATA003]WNB85075.1 glycosyltransferase [Cellulomonas sp. ATA003]
MAVLTYQRPDDLTAILPMLVEHVGPYADATVLVVDNDPAAGAAGSVRGLGDQRVAYTHEPVPGIAAARNRALDEAGDADLLVFVDDDERPEPGWLDALVSTHAREGSLCVVGPVVSRYERDPEPWIVDGRFFDRRRLPTGTELQVAATNNLLIDLRQLRAIDLRFDERFGLSGGRTPSSRVASRRPAGAWSGATRRSWWTSSRRPG